MARRTLAPKLAALFLALVCFAATAQAHEVRPAYLQIRETDRHVYDLMWKTPAQGNARLALDLELPSDCRQAGVPRIAVTESAVLEYSRISCANGLPGQSIVIKNLAASLTDAILRFEPLSGSPKTLRVNGALPSFAVPVRQSAMEVVQTYFSLGVGHILAGYDHLLFVLCLMMLAGTARRIIVAVTMFTLAHSITLAATTLGWVRVASAPVEAAIALSIMFLAAEIVKKRRGGESLVARRPWIASFGFGLLHGFGFASALREVGLPEDSIPLALLFFNLGVEVGQLIFVASVAAIVAAIAAVGKKRTASVQFASRAVPLLTGTLAAFWFTERSLAIIG